MKTGLVLEGGGMRGLYTVGVLDYFMEQSFMPDYIIGVSAGAANAVSYLANQKGRGYSVNIDYLNDKRYVGFSNFIKPGSIFGMDLIFDEIPNKLYPLDYAAIQSSFCELKIGATDVLTGKCVYFGKEHLKENCLILRASSSIPILSPMVQYQDRNYLDGGTSDPIPVKKAISDGCDRVIVVLTQPRGFKKAPQKYKILYKKLFRHYPMMIEALKNRHIIYNQALDYIQKLERQGKAVVIAPSLSLEIGRYEKNKGKLDKVYSLGKNDAQKKFLEILSISDKISNI
jgi:predicted patatin/cPLA2 family phospholipase